MLAIGFAALTLFGALVLMLPISTSSRRPPDFVTALFTSASAVTVTGLSLVDTGTYWSAFGEAVILALIQVGGLGFVTGSILVISGMGHWISLRDREAFGMSFGLQRFGSVQVLALRIVIFTVAVEAAGWALLYLNFVIRGVSGQEWSTLFLSVAAFANAGFDIFGTDDSLIRFRDDPVLLGVTAALIVAGGLGFLVVADVFRFKRPIMWSLDSKLGVSISALLLVFGTVTIFLLERDNPGTLGPETEGVKLLNSAFLSASARTAGFATVDFAKASSESLAFMQALMFVGAAFGSMGGGVKVATVGVLLAVLIGAARGHEDAEIFGRRISPEVVRKAIAVVLFSGLVVTGGGMALGTIFGAPGDDFIKVQFETVSAFAQVGFSAGVSRQAPVSGVLLLTALMYIGRLGPLTLVAVIVGKRRAVPYRFPYGSVRLG